MILTDQEFAFMFAALLIIMALFASIRIYSYINYKKAHAANGGHLVTVSKEVREWMDKNLCNCCTKSPDPKYHKDSCPASKQDPNADLGGNI